MRIKGSILIPTLILGSFAASAQDINEAYNLSNLNVQGTARSMGFGNALGSVGGDFSSISVNPAGLGIYRNSELSITPSMTMSGANSNYLGANTTDNFTQSNLNNFGLVLTHAPKGHRYDHRNWKAVSFAIGMNKVADFNRTYTYEGTNSSSSASQVFESDANKNPGNDSAFGTLANTGYNAYLINYDSTMGKFKSIVPFAGGIDQLKSVQETGSAREFVLALGGNYKEKLMLGFTIGMPNFNYQRNSTYTETPTAGNTNNPYNFNYFTYDQSQTINGTGINGKIGAIYKLTDFFRIGAAFHTPTFYNINDYSNAGISSNAQGNNTGFNVNSNNFNYNLTTPWKGILSATLILKNFGFITADYEYVDYSTMRYQFPGGFDTYGNSLQTAQDNINQEIRKTYQGVSNYRLGGEIKLTKYFMVRAGFGYYGNAYTPYGEANNSFYTTQRIDLSAGLGFHFRHFFTDLGLVHSMYTGYEQPYNVDYSGVVSGPQTTIPQAKIDYSIDNLALTVGFKFR